MRPKPDRKDPMKIVSFNINGIRARIHQLEALKQHLNPDVIGLQEVKVADSRNHERTPPAISGYDAADHRLEESGDALQALVGAAT